MLEKKQIFCIIIFTLMLAITPILGKAEVDRDKTFNAPNLLTDEILRKLRSGENLRVFGKNYKISNSDLYVNVDKPNVKDPQALFDELLARLLESKNSREIIGGGFLAIELDRFLGKDTKNQRNLVDFLSKQLPSEDENNKLFALRALTNRYFPDVSVFSDRSRKNIYDAVSANPELMDIFGYEIEEAERSLLLLVAKAGKTDEALHLLEGIRKMHPEKALLCSISLAKMGIADEQNNLIQLFKNTKDLQEKYKFAYALGAVGGRKAQEALADALRTSGLIAPRPNRPPEMIRLHIAIALVRTIREGRDELPTRGAYGWRGEDLIMIENWASKYLGTKWDVARPEYKPVKKVPF